MSIEYVKCMNENRVKNSIQSKNYAISVHLVLLYGGGDDDGSGGGSSRRSKEAKICLFGNALYRKVERE